MGRPGLKKRLPRKVPILQGIFYNKPPYKRHRKPTYCMTASFFASCPQAALFGHLRGPGRFRGFSFRFTQFLSKKGRPGQEAGPGFSTRSNRNLHFAKLQKILKPKGKGSVVKAASKVGLGISKGGGVRLPKASDHLLDMPKAQAAVDRL